MGVAEIRMLRWMCKHDRRDRMRNEVLGIGDCPSEEVWEVGYSGYTEGYR